MYNFFSENFEYDECTAHGACSVPPGISALHEILLLTLQQSSFYILKLKDLGSDISKFESNVINTFANIVSTTDYSDSQLLTLVSAAYGNLISIRETYKSESAKQGLNSSDIKGLLHLTPKMSLPQIISMGEKIFLEKYKLNSKDQKNYTDIIVFLIKSVSANLSAIMSYKPAPEFATEKLINALNFLNKKSVPATKYRLQIKLLAEVDKTLIEELSSIQLQEYGGVREVRVSKSTRKGKAILVSGSNIEDLRALLNFIGEEKIDVYTHDDLLIAHAFKHFAKYPNLIGHYGSCNDNCVFDFATFPGAILLSKNSNVNTEYLYRGRLFTTSEILPKGVIAVKNNDFQSLIESAKSAKGFAKGQEREPVSVGFDEIRLNKKIGEIVEKFRSGEVRKIVVLGLVGKEKFQYDYFEKLVKLLPKDVFVLSFSYNKTRENFLHLNLVNNRPLIYGVLYKLFQNISPGDGKLGFFFGKCDVSSISNMIYMKEIGVKHLYLTNCSPNVVNPIIRRFLETNYKIRSTTTPEKDVRKFLTE